MNTPRTYDSMARAAHRMNAKAWSVRLRIHRVSHNGIAELFADTDPELPAAHPGATQCVGMRAALAFVVDVLDSFERHRDGLDPATVFGKANSLRVSLANGGLAQRVWTFTDYAGQRYDLEVMIAHPPPPQETLRAALTLVAPVSRPIRG